MKNKLFLLCAVLLVTLSLSAKTINKIVFKRHLCGPVMLKDAGGGWYRVTDGETFPGEYNFLRGYDCNCKGLSVRHKGEYSRPGDNRSDFIRTWYVGESVLPYYNDTYHDCPNEEKDNSSSSGNRNSYDSRNTSSSHRSSSSSSYTSSSSSSSSSTSSSSSASLSSKSFSSRSSYVPTTKPPTKQFDHMVGSWPEDCEICGNWKGSYPKMAIVPNPDEPGYNMAVTVTAYMVLGIGINEDGEYDIKNAAISGIDPDYGSVYSRSWEAQFDGKTLTWVHYLRRVDNYLDGAPKVKYKRKNVDQTYIRLICSATLKDGVLEYTGWVQNSYYKFGGKFLGAEKYEEVSDALKTHAILHRIND